MEMTLLPSNKQIGEGTVTPTSVHSLLNDKTDQETAGDIYWL